MIKFDKLFEDSMITWLSRYPEIPYKLGNNELIISAPNLNDPEIRFVYDKFRIVISCQNESKTFITKDEYNDGVFIKVKGYWINNLVNHNDNRPILNQGEYSILITNHLGQVLTTNGNLHTGWGDMYHIFSCKNSAIEKLDEIDSRQEGYLYDDNFNLILYKTIS